MIAWLDSQVKETLYLTASSLAELLLGAELLPTGKRKTNFRSDLTLFIERLFGDRILPFDKAAAAAYAEIVGRTRQKGHAVLVADGQIAAIAEVHDFAVVTRDTKPFLAAGIRVLDPWSLQR